ncbi:MAG: hypothetical protein N2Z21_10710 [Candidatus Sumerlaeaceae bacterium]|nr:hypothetical protein [Candidatus Sumerlaeaceae bacterium]
MRHGIRHGEWRVTGLILFLFAILACVIVRLPALGERSWWIDELITAQVAARPLVGKDFWDPARKPAESILGFTIQDTGPGPLVYLLEGIFASQASPLGAEFWIRIPGMCAAVLTIALIWFFWKYWWQSSRVAAMSALIMSVFPPWVDFSLGARGYMWTTLILVLLHTTFLKCVRVRPRTEWFAYASMAFLSTVAIYLTPLNIAWLWPYWVVLLFHLLRSAADRRQTIRLYLLSILCVIFFCLPYLLLWYRRLGAKSGALQDFSWTRAVTSFRNFAYELIKEPWYGILIVGPFLLLVLLPRRIFNKPGNRLIRLTCWLMLSSGLLLALYFAGRFFLAPRYFVGFSIPLLWAGGEFLNQVLLILRRRFGRFVAQNLLVLTPAFLCVVEFLPAHRYARTPVHDWLRAVRWLNERIQPSDIVLCGPNADIEVLWAYTKRLGWHGQVPRWLIVEDGRRIDTSTTEAIRRALASGRRLWYITPFWGQIRPPDYWKLIKENFREVARFPGRGDIVLLVHDP